MSTLSYSDAIRLEEGDVVYLEPFYFGSLARLGRVDLFKPYRVVKVTDWEIQDNPAALVHVDVEGEIMQLAPSRLNSSPPEV
jgi:hypothetical protein